MRSGQWSLAPAFDITYSDNPAGSWTAQHQMSLGGKRDGFTPEDLKACGEVALLKRGRALALLQEVSATVARWPEFAAAAGLSAAWSEQIAAAQRLELKPV